MPTARWRGEAVRMQAAELFAQQVKPPEVARRLRVSVKSTYQWQRLWRQGGADALLSRGRAEAAVACRRAVWRSSPGIPGRVRPRTAGREDQVWTAGRVATLIGRKFRASYRVPGATRLMRRLGFTAQMPARGVAERDGQAVTAWKEATWAEVNEPGRSAGAASASRTRRA
ncbi:winged helix-turn-helix domain-containing protein [Streptomyces sp. NBC_01764]|uniref:winged helix-turn-helix domain-containing protein n=2 Tax=unclassified Streptomyces TaxID=2593676 RepID=UPI002256195F|nr:winged helix-turn-helix domain-containing protein [Streptomyces sp. NBC_01764]MCX4410025.1 winged helix-turn-helix domain-containing protein [Streptomyces sp. NBC_01764]